MSESNSPSRPGTTLGSRYSWLTSSHWKMRCTAAIIGFVVFAIILTAEWMMYDFGIAPRHIMLGSAIVAACLALIFSLTLLNNAHARREAVHRRLEIVKETNHHIRNALELIEFSAHSTKDRKLIEQISAGVDRIQWVLREVLGEKGWEALSSSPAAVNLEHPFEKPLDEDDY